MKFKTKQILSRRGEPSAFRVHMASRTLGLVGYHVRPTIYSKTKWHRGPRGWKPMWMTL